MLVVLVNHYVLIGCILVAANNRRRLDLAVAGAMFFLADALSAVGMQMVELDGLGGTDDRIGFHRHDHQAELEQTGPTGPASWRPCDRVIEPAAFELRLCTAGFDSLLSTRKSHNLAHVYSVFNKSLVRLSARRSSVRLPAD